jgi:hypothetical protein
MEGGLYKQWNKRRATGCGNATLDAKSFIEFRFLFHHSISFTLPSTE